MVINQRLALSFIRCAAQPTKSVHIQFGTLTALCALDRSTDNDNNKFSVHLFRLPARNMLSVVVAAAVDDVESATMADDNGEEADALHCVQCALLLTLNQLHKRMIV